MSYCNQECQKLHWFTHKKVCTSLKGKLEGHDIIQIHIAQLDLSIQSMCRNAYFLFYIVEKREKALKDSESATVSSATTSKTKASESVVKEE